MNLIVFVVVVFFAISPFFTIFFFCDKKLFERHTILNTSQYFFMLLGGRWLIMGDFVKGVKFVLLFHSIYFLFIESLSSHGDNDWNNENERELIKEQFLNNKKYCKFFISCLNEIESFAGFFFLFLGSGKINWGWFFLRCWSIYCFLNFFLEIVFSKAFDFVSAVSSVKLWFSGWWENYLKFLFNTYLWCFSY